MNNQNDKTPNSDVTGGAASKAGAAALIHDLRTRLLTIKLAVTNLTETETAPADTGESTNSFTTKTANHVMQQLDLINARLDSYWSDFEDNEDRRHPDQLAHTATAPAIPQEMSDKPKDTSSSSPREVSVLLIDDDVSHIEITERVFRHNGYDIDTCLSGQEGLRALAEKNYTIVFIDQYMPVMSGPAFAAEWYALQPVGRKRTTHLVGISSSPDIAASRHACLSSGMDEFLSKPLTIEKIEALLVQLGHIAK